jgi:hypothetical protein
MLITLGVKAQTTLPFFSELSNQPAYTPTFDAIPYKGHLYYYINHRTPSYTEVYKIDQSGTIVNTAILTEAYVLLGNFLTYNDRLFFDGYTADYEEIRAHKLIEFDENLNIVLEQSWVDILPPLAGFNFWRASNNATFYDRGARMIRNDTLYSIMPYTIDLFLPKTHYEVLGLDGSVYLSKDMKSLDSLHFHTNTTIGPEAFYIFGYMEGPTAPNGENYNFENGGLMGRFNLQTGVVESTTWFNDSFIGTTNDGSAGQYINGRLFCSAFTGSPLQSSYAGSGCPEKTVVLEVRTPELELINGFNMPTCGFITNGGRPFVSDNEGFIYYANYNIAENQTYIFKFDSSLNLIWQQTYAILFPYSILYTENNQIILNCITDLINSPTLQIHRINAEDGGLVNTTALPIHTAKPLTYFPNPFTETVQTELEQAQHSSLMVFNTAGQLVTEVAAPCTKVNLGHLPAGAYTIKMYDEQTRQLVGQQQVVKQ